MERNHEYESDWESGRGGTSHDSSSRRGFAAMDPERRREIASMGGRASHGARSRDDDENHRGDGGGRSSHDSDWEAESSRRSISSSRRGFAAMDPERQRKIASMGGRASQEERDPEERREIGRRGGRARWDHEAYEDVERGEYRRGGRHPMGFAAMDPKEQREIASMGGRASHSGDEEGGDSSRSRSSSRSSIRSSSHHDHDFDDHRTSGSSRRGFAAMDPERQREIASMGGRASHGGRGRDHESARYADEEEASSSRSSHYAPSRH